MRSSSRRPPAFTLVEVLAATALAALLLGAAMSLAVSVKLGERQLTAADHAGDRAESIVRLLRDDLILAQEFRFDEGLSLVGYGGLDPVTGAAGHTPAVVRYYLAPVEERTALVRTQQDSAGEASVTRLVALDVDEFRVEPSEAPNRAVKYWRPSAVTLTLVSRAGEAGGDSVIERWIPLP